jgi:hypothetical protein
MTSRGVRSRFSSKIEVNPAAIRGHDLAPDYQQIEPQKLGMLGDPILDHVLVRKPSRSYRHRRIVGQLVQSCHLDFPGLFSLHLLITRPSCGQRVPPASGPVVMSSAVDCTYPV